MRVFTQEMQEKGIKQGKTAENPAKGRPSQGQLPRHYRKIILIPVPLLLLLLPAILHPQTADSAPESWQNASALILRLRDVNLELRAREGVALSISGMDPSREWSYEVQQGQLVVEALPLPGPNPRPLSLQVTVRPEVEVQVFTTTGNIFISGSNNLRILHSLKGSISLLNTRGQLKVETLTGNLDIQSHQGDFNLRTTSGRIRFLGARPVRQSQILTTSGNIFVQLLVNRNQLKLESSTLNSDFTVYGNTMQNRYRFGNGEISLTVASSTGQIEVSGP